MPCTTCGSTLMLHHSMDAYCPNCDHVDNGHILDKEETEKWFHDRLFTLKAQILAQLKDYDTQILLFNLNRLRDEFSKSNVLEFLAISRGMSLILESESLTGKRTLSLEDILTAGIIEIIVQFYTMENLAFHAKFDRVRIAQSGEDPLHPSEDPVFTEHWFPIFARTYILGLYSDNGEIQSDIRLALWHNFNLRNIIIERLDDEGKQGKKLNEYIKWKENLYYHHPSQLFPIRSRSVKHLTSSFIINILHKTSGRNAINTEEWHSFLSQLSRKEQEICQLNTTRIESIQTVPLFVIPPGSGQILIPPQFLEKFAEVNKTLFGPQGREFKHRYGLMYEEYALDALKSFKIHYKDQNNQPFLHYKNPVFHTNDELFDIGFYSMDLKKLYICELKAVLGFQLRESVNYDAELEKYFRKFHDITIPRIQVNLNILGLEGYSVEPIFMTLAPTFETREFLMDYSVRAGITVTHSIAGICAKLSMDLKKLHLLIDDLYPVPPEFFEIIKSPPVQEYLTNIAKGDVDIHDIDARIPKDAGHIRTGKVLLVEQNEIDIEILMNPFKGTPLFINIPERIREKVNQENPQVNNLVKIAFYRGFPHSMVHVLEDIVVFKGDPLKSPLKGEKSPENSPNYQEKGVSRKIDTFQEWISLPELPIKKIDAPEKEGSVYEIIRAGLLQIHTFGTVELFPTATVKEQNQEIIYRLPRNLIEWVSDMFSITHYRGKPFPCLVDFGNLGDRIMVKYPN